MIITAIATRLFDWLGLRAGERRETAFGFTILLLVISGHAMLETARDTLFLSELSVDRLPWAYLSIAGLALLAGRTFNGSVSRWPRGRTLMAALVGGAVVNVVFWHLCADRRASILFALYVWTGLIATLVTLQFWLLAGDVLDVGRAKRVFAIIGAGGPAGATLGAALAGVIVTVARPRALILAGAVLFGIAALVTRVWERGHAAMRPGPAAGGSAAPVPRESLRRDPYLGRLLVVTLLATIVATGIDYLFKAAVAANVPKGELAHFLARYHTFVNGSALAFQLLAAPRLLQGLGVVPALSLLPSLVLLGATASAVAGSLLPALLVKAADGTMRHSLDRAGNEILYLPLGDAVRERFRALTTSLGQRGGQAIASIAILFAGWIGASYRELALGLAVLSAGWLATLASLRGHYVGRFREQLRAFSRGAQGSLPPLDLRSLEVLLEALSSADDAEVLAALDMLEAYGKRDLVSPFLVHHPSRAVALRALALFADTPRPEVLRIVDRLLEHEDGEVRAAVLQMRTAHRPDEALLRDHLRDVHSAAVRCTALVGLVAAGFIHDEAHATAALRQALDHATPDAGPILASALRDLPPRFAALFASELSRSPDPRFGAEVAKVIASDPSPVFLDTLLELLARREARVPAREALVGLGDVALDRLVAALADPSTPFPVRLHIPRTVSRFESERAAAILVGRLATETDERITYKILRGLGRLRSDDPRIPVDRSALLAVAEAQVRRAVMLLALRVGWSALERTGTPRTTGGAMLLPALLEEKERRAVEAVFRILHVLEPDAGYAIAYRGLASADAAARASGRELTENLIRGRLRAPLLALTDTLPPAARLEGALDDDDVPGAHALLAIAESDAPLGPADVARLHALARELAAVVFGNPTDVVHELARQELEGLAWPWDARRTAGGADGG